MFLPSQPLGEYQPFFTLNRKRNTFHGGLQENAGYPLAGEIAPPRQHPVQNQRIRKCGC